MTIFKDRLARTIRVTGKFATSEERKREVRNKSIAAVILVLAILVVYTIFGWLS